MAFFSFSRRTDTRTARYYYIMLLPPTLIAFLCSCSRLRRYPGTRAVRFHPEFMFYTSHVSCGVLHRPPSRILCWTDRLLFLSTWRFYRETNVVPDSTGPGFADTGATTNARHRWRGAVVRGRVLFGPFNAPHPCRNKIIGYTTAARFWFVFDNVSLRSAARSINGRIC